jgi:signal peptidase I
MEQKPRSAAVAAVLSLFMPGLGHLYAGRVGLALLFYPIAFLGPAIFIGGFAGLDWSLRGAFRAAGWTWLFFAAGCCVHAALTARRAGAEYRLRPFNLWYFYLLLWVAGVALPAFGITRWVQGHLLTRLDLVSDGMMPTLLPGDMVLIDRRARALSTLQRGDVIALRDPADSETIRIARLIGLAGDQIELAPDGMRLNGEAIRREEAEADTPGTKYADWLDGRKFIVMEDADRAARRSASFRVGPEEIFAIGDNRTGAPRAAPVPRRDVLGRAILVMASRDPKTGAWRSERRNLPLGFF